MQQSPLDVSARVRFMRDLRPLADGQSTKTDNGLPTPNAAQMAFMDLELGMFIHFGMNTFTGEGTGGKGTCSPELFNPTALDCDNWMEVAVAMGARFAVLTTRHEEGFCLWPTDSTDYSVKHSPYKNGRGDVVREFVDACRRHGIKPCLYHPSYMDAHHIFKIEDKITWHQEWFHSTNKRLSEPQAADRFTSMQVCQIRELLTRYNEIDYLWLDHIGETQGILNPDAVEAFWLAIVAEARRLQPNCLLLKNDIFFSRDLDVGGGVHGGRAAYPLWHRCRREDTPEGQGDPVSDPDGGNQFIVWESNTIFSGGWFWNGPAVKPVSDMIEHYYATVGRGSTFLPNFAPDRRGLMTDSVREHAVAFGDRVRSLTENALAETAGIGPALELKLPSVLAIDHVVIMEDLREGQKIAAYTLEAQHQDGTWSQIVSGRSVGHKRIDRFPKIRTNAVRFTCTQSFAEPVCIRSLAAFVTDTP